MPLTIGRPGSVRRLIVAAAIVASALVFQTSSASAQWLGIAAAWSAPGSTDVVETSSATTRTQR